MDPDDRGGRLARTFYRRPTLEVARDLVGQHLVRRLEGQCVRGKIVEVEAYIGREDAASHAHSGQTERNAAMFGPPGYAYVYFIYGMHHCFNVVTEREGYPAAVLVRALEPLVGIESMRRRRKGRRGIELTNGPAKLCYALDIRRELDGADLVAGSDLWLERGEPVCDDRIVSGSRINVRGDADAISAPWRFWIRDNAYVSK
jgi:DNA-3-methyladenine glycosylase